MLFLNDKYNVEEFKAKIKIELSKNEKYNLHYSDLFKEKKGVLKICKYPLEIKLIFQGDLFKRDF